MWTKFANGVLRSRRFAAGIGLIAGAVLTPIICGSNTECGNNLRSILEVALGTAW